MVFVLIRKHEIDIETGTVRRNHIKFPDVKQKKSTFKKKIILEEKWKLISEFLVDGDKVVSNKRNISVEKSYKEKMLLQHLRHKGHLLFNRSLGH